jgi:hypothetical protein
MGSRRAIWSARAVRSQYGIAEPRRALAEALAGNLDAPWLNRNGEAEHG